MISEVILRQSPQTKPHGKPRRGQPTRSAWRLVVVACALLTGPAATSASEAGYGPLVPDPDSLLDLPAGFSYRTYSTAVSSKTDDPRFSQTLSDGSPVPCRHDGMGAFAGPNGITVLIRNHELRPNNWPGTEGDHKMYDPESGGGTTTLWIGRDGELIRSFVSLSGTLRNCSGGPTPWGSWLSAEESTYMPGRRHPTNRDLTEDVTKPHGYMFEVDSRAEGPVDPVPIRAMGRFYHEAAAVDPATGFVYLTEDRWDGLIYRYRPKVVTSGRKTPSEMEVGDLHKGGTLEAMRLIGQPRALAQNWEATAVEVGKAWAIDWVEIPNIEPKMDMERVSKDTPSRFRSRTASTSIRAQGFRLGAAQFAFGEGMVAHRGYIDFTASKGGERRIGQLWRIDAARQTLTLLAEPNDKDVLEGPDNMTVASNGDILMCEDGRGRDHIVGWTPAGELYTFARNAWNDSELAGACFSPDGTTLFVNMQNPGITFGIRGPWKELE